MKNIYLDYNASTPVDERVVDAVLPFFVEKYGNPSSTNNHYGREANRAVNQSLRIIADYFSVESLDDIIVTSGATEANNLVLSSFFKSNKKNCRIITSRIEHDSVLKTAESLSDEAEIVYVKNDSNGMIDLNDLEDKLKKPTSLLSIMGANNEIGTIQPIEAIADLAKKYSVPFHCDATQLIPYKRIDLSKLDIDYISMSGHKIYAPKGVGLLICRNDNALSKIKAQILGGGQQNGYRSGTLNVPGIVGIAEAIEILDSEIEKDSIHNQLLYECFFDILEQRKIPYHLNGDKTNRINGNISIAIDRVTSVQLLSWLSDFSISTGSACSSGKKSHVLTAISCPESIISGTVRISFGRFTQQDDIVALANKIADLYDNMKKYYENQ